jgi:hypothetical protein
MIGASDALVSTRLRPFQTRPNLVARPRLIAKLEPEAGHKLALISAPAGFGKTTLLGEWAASRSDEQCVAWVSLDEADNDPARFLSYLVAALQTVEEEIGEGVLSSLHAPGSAPVVALTAAPALRLPPGWTRRQVAQEACSARRMGNDLCEKTSLLSLNFRELRKAEVRRILLPRSS